MNDTNNSTAMIGEGNGGGQSMIVDVTTSSFMAEVIEASQSQPVIVGFWAAGSAPCEQLMLLLEKSVMDAKGTVKLAKANIGKNQAIAAQLKVQSAPTVYAFVNGQPVDGFAGEQAASTVHEFVDRLVQQAGGIAPNIDELLEQATAAIGQKNFAEATGLFAQVLDVQPSSEIAMAGLLRCLIGTGEYDDARAMIDAMTDEMQASDAVQKAINALNIAEQGAASAGQLDIYEAAVATNPDDLEAKFNLAVAQFGGGQHEAAIASLLEIFIKDRSWNDDAARRKLLEIFDVLGATAPEVMDGRRKLSSILFS